MEASSTRIDRCRVVSAKSSPQQATTSAIASWWLHAARSSVLDKNAAALTHASHLLCLYTPYEFNKIFNSLCYGMAMANWTDAAVKAGTTYLPKRAEARLRAFRDALLEAYPEIEEEFREYHHASGIALSLPTKVNHTTVVRCWTHSRCRLRGFPDKSLAMQHVDGLLE